MTLSARVWRQSVYRYRYTSLSVHTLFLFPFLSDPGITGIKLLNDACLQPDRTCPLHSLGNRGRPNTGQARSTIT